MADATISLYVTLRRSIPLNFVHYRWGAGPHLHVVVCTPFDPPPHTASRLSYRFFHITRSLPTERLTNRQNDDGTLSVRIGRFCYRVKLPRNEKWKTKTGRSYLISIFTARHYASALPALLSSGFFCILLHATRFSFLCINRRLFIALKNLHLLHGNCSVLNAINCTSNDVIKRLAS